MVSRILRLARQAAFYGLLYLLWQTVYNLKLWPAYLVPSPADVVQALTEGLKDGSYFSAAGASLARLMAGYCVSVFFGIGLGVASAKWSFFDETVGRLFVALQTLPSICWLPLTMLWFGAGELAIFVVVAMGSLLSIAIATKEGLRSIQPLYLQAGRNMGASGRNLFLKVMLPAAFPMILAGLKQGWIFAWRSLMAGEILMTGVGLGGLLNTGRQMNDMGQVLSVMLTIVAVGAMIDLMFFNRVERKVRTIWGVEQRA